MNKFLESAVSRYPEVLTTSLITPISRVDGEIIEEIMRIVSNDRLLLTKLSLWKYSKDEEILKSLKEYTVPENIFREFVLLGDIQIDVTLISSFERGQEYSFISGKMNYYIVINKLPDTTTVQNIYTNKKVDYETEFARDRDYKNICEIMKKNGFRFLNEE